MGAAETGGPGIRMLVVQLRQRTVLPRAEAGTARTFRQVRFGHMMRIVSEAMVIGLSAPGVTDRRFALAA